MGKGENAGQNKKNMLLVAHGRWDSARRALCER